MHRHLDDLGHFAQVLGGGGAEERATEADSNDQGALALLSPHNVTIFPAA
jgi:hypothetical protein